MSFLLETIKGNSKVCWSSMYLERGSCFWRDPYFASGKIKTLAFLSFGAWENVSPLLSQKERAKNSSGRWEDNVEVTLSSSLPLTTLAPSSSITSHIRSTAKQELRTCISTTRTGARKISLTFFGICSGNCCKTWNYGDGL